MLDFNDIVKSYPERVRAFKENILVEYLQHKIINIIFSTKYAQKLVFLGGTALRIVYNNSRFSQDLDFDNFKLTQSEFIDIIKTVREELELDGYNVETRNIFGEVFRCYLKFPGMLFNIGLSGHKAEKVLIQIDTQPQGYTYIPEKYLLNKFGFFRYINVVPQPLLLAQKVHALLTRKREKGRDFFDVVYLMSKTEPDFGFLKLKLNITSKAELIAKLKKFSLNINFKLLVRDVESFLIEPDQKDRILYFKEWLDTLR